MFHYIFPFHSWSFALINEKYYLSFVTFRKRIQLFDAKVMFGHFWGSSIVAKTDSALKVSVEKQLGNLLLLFEVDLLFQHGLHKFCCLCNFSQQFARIFKSFHWYFFADFFNIFSAISDKFLSKSIWYSLRYPSKAVVVLMSRLINTLHFTYTKNSRCVNCDFWISREVEFTSLFRFFEC